jgi:hypothetical protein
LEVQTSLGNNAVIQDVKNDFTVWGKKKSTAGELPIHMRVAIQKKPTRYAMAMASVEVNGIKQPLTYTTKKETSEKDNVIECDWREIIY